MPKLTIEIDAEQLARLLLPPPSRPSIEAALDDIAIRRKVAHAARDLVESETTPDPTITGRFRGRIELSSEPADPSKATIDLRATALDDESVECPYQLD